MVISKARPAENIAQYGGVLCRNPGIPGRGMEERAKQTAPVGSKGPLIEPQDFIEIPVADGVNVAGRGGKLPNPDPSRHAAEIVLSGEPVMAINP